MATRWLKASYWKNVSDPPIKTSTGTELFHLVFKREAKQRNLGRWQPRTIQACSRRVFWEVIRFREWRGATKDLSKCSLITVFELMNDGKEWEFCWMHDYSRYGPSTRYQVYTVYTRSDIFCIYSVGVLFALQNLKPVLSWHRQLRTGVPGTTIYVYIPNKPVLVLQIPYVRSTGQAIPCSRWWFIFPSTLAIFVVDRRWCCRPS